MRKRLVVPAIAGPIVAAISRRPFPWHYHNVERATLVSFIFIVALVIYDLWSTHKIHRATLWGQPVCDCDRRDQGMIGATEHWHTCARWMQSWNI